MFLELVNCTAQRMKFFIKDLFGECVPIFSFLRVCLHLYNKSLTENFVFSAGLTFN